MENDVNIICMGDSITYGFGLAELSDRWTDLTAARTGHTLVNRGVSGDTTAGMLARCQTQVFNQTADALLFLGGINDLSIHGQSQIVYANVISVFRQAVHLDLPVILGVPLPICPEDIGAPAWDAERDGQHLAALCEQYANWIRQYAADNQIPVVDFRTPFLLPDGKPDRTLFQDGLHPNEEGHRLMADALCEMLKHDM